MPTKGLETRPFYLQYSSDDFVSTFLSDPGSGCGMFCFVSGLFPDVHMYVEPDHK
jgi:hypothetical protein